MSTERLTAPCVKVQLQRGTREAAVARGGFERDQLAHSRRGSSSRSERFHLPSALVTSPLHFETDLFAVLIERRWAAVEHGRGVGHPHRARHSRDGAQPAMRKGDAQLSFDHVRSENTCWIVLTGPAGTRSRQDCASHLLAASPPQRSLQFRDQQVSFGHALCIGSGNEDRPRATAAPEPRRAHANCASLPTAMAITPSEVSNVW